MLEPGSHTPKSAKASEDIRERPRTNISFLDQLAVDTPTDAPLNTDSATESDLPHSSTSMLFKLPSEIRNMIYELAVRSPSEPLFLDDIETPALARTCRRLRKEVLPIFVHVNTFNVKVRPLNAANQTNRTVFNIRPETFYWLCDLGLKIPLFTSLYVHFGRASPAALGIFCDRAGMRLTHETTCNFCHPEHDVPPLPVKLYKDAGVDISLMKQVIAINQTRRAAHRAEHDHHLVELRDRLIGAGFVDERAIALSMDDMATLEKGINTSVATFTLAIQGVSQSRLRQTPLLLRVDNKLYSLIREE